ncbi:MAG: discoidin domain-containing protein [Chitinophagaceae bacterium]|nr:MAG: discoidin domain-containing protein [Chitinophagaceae bacterium]
MKKIYFILAVLLMANYCQAQTNTFPPSGNVGIGTTSPRANVEVNGTGLIQGFVNLGEWSDVAIGEPVIISGGVLYDNGPTFNGADSYWAATSAGQHIQIDLGSDVYIGGIAFGTYWKGDIRFIPLAYHIDYSTDGSIWTNLVTVTENPNLYIYHSFPVVVARYVRLTIDSFQNGESSANISGLRIFSDDYATNFGNNIWSILPGVNESNAVLGVSGNVLIGKTSQTNSSYKLDVNGNIRANQVTVNATGADYVFNPFYHIRSIDSLNNYIKEYHHLPEISSAKQMRDEGDDIGTTQMKMLQNEEEMALYIISINKKVQKLERQVKQLNAQMKKLKLKSKDK